MNKVILLAFLLLGACVKAEKKESAPDVYPENRTEIAVLTEATIDEYIQKNGKIFIQFFAPWCSYCGQFYSEFVQIPNELKDESSPLHGKVSLAQVNLEQNKSLMPKYKIDVFPSYILISEGKEKGSMHIARFKGPYVKADFVYWLKRKLVSPVEFITKASQIEEHQNSEVISFFYFTHKHFTVQEINNITDPNFSAFLFVARREDKFKFCYCEYNEEIFDKYNIPKKESEETIVVFKPFDNKRNDLHIKEDFNVTTFGKFLIDYSNPNVMEFTDSSREVIFSRQKPGLFLFRDPTNSTSKKYDELIEEVAPEIKEKLQVVKSGYMNRDEPRLMEFLGLRSESFPLIYILDTREDFKKYVLKKEITKENILEFVSEWEKDELEQALNSEEIPKENKGPVFTLVGKTFQNMVKDDDIDRLVLFYSPHCQFCSKFRPEYKKLAEKYHPDLNKKFRMYAIDVTQNDIGKVSIRQIPNVKLYRAKNAELNPISFDDTEEVNFKNVEGFILAKTKYPLVAKEEQKKGEDRVEEPKIEGKIEPNKKEIKEEVEGDL